MPGEDRMTALGEGVVGQGEHSTGNAPPEQVTTVPADEASTAHDDDREGGDREEPPVRPSMVRFRIDGAASAPVRPPPDPHTEHRAEAATSGEGPQQHGTGEVDEAPGGGGNELAGDADEGPTIIEVNLHVELASVRSILGHYFLLFFLLLVPAILLLIGIILPFWLQDLVVVSRYVEPFPYAVTWGNMQMFNNSYARYAPCLVFKAWFCAAATDASQWEVVYRWIVDGARHLQPVLGRMALRGGDYVVERCVLNASSPITNMEAAMLITALNEDTGDAARFEFAVQCTTDRDLAPMVNITTTLVSRDAVAPFLPTGDALVAEKAVRGQTLVEASVLTQHEYDMSLSSCADFLANCSSFGYRYVWTPSQQQQHGDTGEGYVHQCTEPNSSLPLSEFSPPSASSALTPEGLSAAVAAKKMPGRALAPGDYTTVLVCDETVYEVEAANRLDYMGLDVEATVRFRFFGQLGGVRFVRREVLTSMGLILPVIIFIVTEVLLAFSALLIIMVGYTLPVQRFQLRQLRTAVLIDANILAEAISRQVTNDSAPAPQQPTSPGLDPSSPASPETPATADETFVSRQGSTATATAADNSRNHPSTLAGEDEAEMASWPYGRGRYLAPGAAGPANEESARPARVDDGPSPTPSPGDGPRTEEDAVVFSPAEAPASPTGTDTRGATPHPSASGRQRRSNPTLSLPPLVRTPSSSPSGSPGTAAQSAAQVSPTLPAPSGRQRRQSSGAGTSADTSPLLAISNAALAARGPGDPATPLESGGGGAPPAPSFEAIAAQSKVIRGILFTQKSSILLALVFAVVGLVFVLAGVGNPVGWPCSFAAYPYCTYHRSPRAQHIVLTSLALFFILILIGFQCWIIRRRVW